MRLRLIIFLTSSAIFLGACHRKQPLAVLTVRQCDTCCLKKLSHFVDTLNIDTAKPFEYYFAEKRFSLGNCNLKKFRGNTSFKSSLILFWLKIDNVYLQKHWGYAYSQDIGGQSSALRQLVLEFYFLFNNKDEPYGIEFFSPGWASSMVTKDSSLLKNKHIKVVFEQNKFLRKLRKAKV